MQLDDVQAPSRGITRWVIWVVNRPGPTAQRRVAAFLRRLSDGNPLWVGVEKAEGSWRVDISGSPSIFPAPDVAEKMLMEGRLTGVEYAGIQDPRVRVVGVDDRALQHKEGRLREEINKGRTGVWGAFRQAEANIAALKKVLEPASLRQWNADVARYRKGAITEEDLVRRWASESEGTGLPSWSRWAPDVRERWMASFIEEKKRSLLTSRPLRALSGLESDIHLARSYCSLEADIDGQRRWRGRRRHVGALARRGEAMAHAAGISLNSWPDLVAEADRCDEFYAVRRARWHSIFNKLRFENDRAVLVADASERETVVQWVRSQGYGVAIIDPDRSVPGPGPAPAWGMGAPSVGGGPSTHGLRGIFPFGIPLYVDEVDLSGVGQSLHSLKAGLSRAAHLAARVLIGVLQQISRWHAFSWLGETVDDWKNRLNLIEERRFVERARTMDGAICSALWGELARAHAVKMNPVWQSMLEESLRSAGVEPVKATSESLEAVRTTGGEMRFHVIVSDARALSELRPDPSLVHVVDGGRGEYTIFILLPALSQSGEIPEMVVHHAVRQAELMKAGWNWEDARAAAATPLEKKTVLLHARLSAMENVLRRYANFIAAEALPAEGSEPVPLDALFTGGWGTPGALLPRDLGSTPKLQKVFLRLGRSQEQARREAHLRAMWYLDRILRALDLLQRFIDLRQDVLTRLPGSVQRTELVAAAVDVVRERLDSVGQVQALLHAWDPTHARDPEDLYLSVMETLHGVLRLAGTPSVKEDFHNLYAQGIRDGERLSRGEEVPAEKVSEEGPEVDADPVR